MKPGLYYHHHRTHNGGVITFAIEVVKSPKNWVQFSFALCSPKDKFFKCWGRRIAEARLNCKRAKHVSGFNAGDIKLSEVIRQVVTEFWMAVRRKQDWVRMRHGIIPGWVLRAERAYRRRIAEEAHEKISEEIKIAVGRGLDALSDPKKEVKKLTEATA